MTHPQKTRELVVEAVRQTANIAEACKLAGVTRRTVYRWQEDDQEYAQQIEDAREDALDAIEHSLYRRAVEGKSDIAAFFLLKRWRPQYRENSTIDINAQVTHTFDFNRLSDEGRLQLLTLAASELQRRVIDTTAEDVTEAPPNAR